MSDITIDASEVTNNLKNMTKRTKAGITVIGNTVASQMKEYAQSNHKWIDRTGSATDEITADAKWEGTTLDISITHGVDYGIWLETRRDFEGKYKILEEARDSQIETFKSMLLALRLEAVNVCEPY